MWIGATVLLVALYTIGYLIWLENQPSVLSRSITKDPLSGEPTKVVLNPLRDRAPERSADTMIRAMHDGHCREELADWFKDYRQKYATFICDSEQQHPLVAWTLFDREEDPPLVMLHYRAKRKEPNAANPYTEDLWVTTQNRDGAWAVTKYGAFY